MMRWNCHISTGSRSAAAFSRVVPTPITEVRGIRSSWLFLILEGVANGDRSLWSEHDQGLLVFFRKLFGALLFRKVDVTDRFAEVADGRSEEGLHRRMVLREADRVGVLGEIRESQRPFNLAQVAKDSQALGRFSQKLALFRRNTGGNELSNTPGVVEHPDRAILGIGQRTGSVYDLLKHGVEVPTLGYAAADLAHHGEPLPQPVDLSHFRIVPAHVAASRTV